MPIMYNDNAQFFVEHYKTAVNVEVQGIAEYYPENEEKYYAVNNDRPEYFRVSIHLENGTRENVLDCSNYAVTVEYAEDLARLKSLPIHDYVSQRIPDPFQRVRSGKNDGKYQKYCQLIEEYISWIGKRKFPEMSAQELLEEADHLLEDNDTVYLSDLFERWKQVEIGNKIDLSMIETSEETMYF